MHEVSGQNFKHLRISCNGTVVLKMQSTLEGRIVYHTITSLNECHGYHFCFIFGRSRVQISARTPSVLTEAFSGFPQSLQANGEIN
jgi:hypothetical protein